MTHALTPSFLPVIVIASLTCVSHGKMFIADNKEGIISKKWNMILQGTVSYDDTSGSGLRIIRTLIELTVVGTVISVSEVAAERATVRFRWNQSECGFG